MASDTGNGVELLVEQWRNELRQRQAMSDSELQALERRLQAQLVALDDAGLGPDEIFLIALRRIGASHPVAREVARDRSQQFCTELTTTAGDASLWNRSDALVAFCLAALAAILIKLPELFGLQLEHDGTFYARNMSLFVLPLLTGYFAWKRGTATTTRIWFASAFVAAAGFANVNPFVADRYPQELTAIHLPIALWLAVAIAYCGGRWSDAAKRMDFIRFSGQMFIYYVLIALGGIVFCGVMMALFHAIGVNMAPVFERWILPCGAIGAVMIAAWLVEAKQGVIEHIAPLLTRLFTPLFTLLLLAFLASMAWTGRGLEFQRELILVLDLLLVVVLGLLLYAISARDHRQAPGAFDVLQVVLVVCALLVDAMALWSIAARISEFGFTPNRVAALGENVILLVNLAGSAVLYLRFVRGRGAFADLERWQTKYLPVYALWAAVVVVVFPPLFAAL